jgi:hypothetical protein
MPRASDLAGSVQFRYIFYINNLSTTGPEQRYSLPQNVGHQVHRAGGTEGFTGQHSQQFC